MWINIVAEHKYSNYTHVLHYSLTAYVATVGPRKGKNARQVGLLARASYA